MSGYRKNRKTIPEKKPLSHGWIVVPSKTYPDRVYFYNTVTKCSTWENPCEPSRSKSSKHSSSESSSSSSLRISSSSQKSSSKARSKISKPKVQSSFITSRANDEIEDYDDQYFENVPVSPIGKAHSSLFSPPSSPELIFSPKPNLTDDPSPKTISSDEKKELWLHFASSPEKSVMRKSLALSDFGKPSTSSKISETNVEKKSPRSRDIIPAETSKKEIPSKAKKKKKKKRSRSASEARKKKSQDKIINKTSFKRKDKTPAQTRLLKLREENAEVLKKIAGSEATRNQDLDSPKFSSDSASAGNSDKFNNEYLKNLEIVNNDPTRKPEDNSVTDFSEEMDWEPSNEELDVQSINEFRQSREKVNIISNEIFSNLASEGTQLLPFQSNPWLLVLDTNIFVSCLSFIKEIRDTNIPGLGYPFLYIPWRVLQELDHLKDSKINNQRQWNVRKAIAYLNENFKSKHPRCFGQSYQDFSNMVDVEKSAPDDEILQTCMRLKTLHPDKKLTLLTNDKNLESKAIISGLEVYSKERFEKRYLMSDSVSDLVLNGTSSSAETEAKQIDNAVCAVKTILKNTIPPIVEEELKLAFQDDWVRLAFKKPPWTLQDSLDCFVKHWRSVFFLVFSKDTLSDIKKLTEKLFQEEIATSENVKETICAAQRLLTGMKRSLKKKRLYKAFLDASATKLLNLLQEISQQRPQVEAESPVQSQSALPQFSLLPAVNGSSLHSALISQALLTDNDVEEAKNLFRDIWDSLRSFCCSVSDLVNFPSTNNSISIPEIRLKLSQVLNELGELVLVVDKIFEINLNEIHEGHPLVLHLSSFLIKANASMNPDVRNRLPKCLAAFFSDPEGRSLLSGSMIDFREFSRDLVKAAEYFERNYSTF